jgi:hypothetical protein
MIFADIKFIYSERNLYHITVKFDLMDQRIKTFLIITAAVVLIYIILSTSWNNNGCCNIINEKYEQVSLPSNSKNNYMYDQSYVDPKVHPYSRVVSYRPYAQSPIPLIPVTAATFDMSWKDIENKNIKHNKKQDNTQNNKQNNKQNNSQNNIQTHSSGSDTVLNSGSDTVLNPDLDVNAFLDHVVDQKLGKNVDANTFDTEPKVNTYFTHHKITQEEPDIDTFDQNVKKRKTSYNDTQINGDSIYETNNIVGYCMAPGEHFGVYSISGDDTRIIPMNDPRFGPSLDQVDMETVEPDLDQSGVNPNGIDNMTEDEMTMTDNEYYKLMLNRPNERILIKGKICIPKEGKKVEEEKLMDMNRLIDQYRANTFDTYRGLYKNSSATFAIRNGGKMYDIVD